MCQQSSVSVDYGSSVAAQQSRANAVHHAVLFLHRGGHFIFKINKFKTLLLERVCGRATRYLNSQNICLGKKVRPTGVLFWFITERRSMHEWGLLRLLIYWECWKMTIHISAGKMKEKSQTFSQKTICGIIRQCYGDCKYVVLSVLRWHCQNELLSTN